MLGMKVYVPCFEVVVGVVDAVSVDPAGRAMVRVGDKWFEAAYCIGA